MRRGEQGGGWGGASRGCLPQEGLSGAGETGLGESLTLTVRWKSTEAHGPSDTVIILLSVCRRLACWDALAVRQTDGLADK